MTATKASTRVDSNCSFSSIDADAEAEANDDELVEGHSVGALMTMELYSPYTREEGNWMQQTLRQFDEAYNSIKYCDDMIKEFLMYNLDVPLPRTFSNVCTR